MSLAYDREALRAALEGVEGVRAAHGRAPGRVTKGDAFPVLVSFASDGFGPDSGAITWAATVVLGQDLAEADALVETLLGPLRTALAGEMILGDLSMSSMVAGGATIYVAQQTGVREYAGEG